MHAIFRFLATPALLVIGKLQLILAVLIYFYAAWTASPVGIDVLPDYVMHFLGNAMLFGSFWWAFFLRRPAWKIWFFLLPFSVLVELGQGMTIHRTVSIIDIAANVLGISLALLFALFLQKQMLKAPQEKP